MCRLLLLALLGGCSPTVSGLPAQSVLNAAPRSTEVPKLVIENAAREWSACGSPENLAAIIRAWRKDRQKNEAFLDTLRAKVP